MMPVAKHGDPQMGVDIHLCVVPPSPSPVPLPTPHMSVVFDPFDYLPILGATVTVCGMKRAVAGTAGKAVHIPPGFPFAPKIPDTDDEVFMGSATVVADGDPFSFLTVPVLACQVAGMPSPPRLKQHEKKLMLLPTVVNMAIPTNVFIGGPPTISMMGMAFKLGFAALGRLAKSKLAKALGRRFKEWRKAKFGHLKSDFLRCVILRAEPVNIVTGAVSIEQEDFVLPGRLPVRWTRRYSSDNPRRGACGKGWECPTDARLEHDAESGIVLFYHPETGMAIFQCMPPTIGEEAAVLELMDGSLLSDHGTELRVRTKEDRIYRFPKELCINVGGGKHEYPLSQVDDMFGNSLTWERASDGRPLALIDAAGRRIELDSGPDGLIQQVSIRIPDSGYRQVCVAYQQDMEENLVEVRDALGNPYRFAYESHHMVRHTNRNGLSFYYEYDQTGESRRVVRSWGDGGLYAYKFSYFDQINERKITDSLGNTSTVKLDERGLPISETDALGGVTTYEYDEAGRTAAFVDPDMQRTEYVFDERGNLTMLRRPDGAAMETEFDDRNKPVALLDADGSRWIQHWDELGRLRRQVSPTGNASTWDYDHHGQLATFTNPRGAQTKLVFDPFGNVIGSRDPLGATTTLAYDEVGNLTAQEDALGNKMRFHYDVKSRLTRLEQPDGRDVTCKYDKEDNLVGFSDQNGAETRLEYYGLGQLKRRILPDGSSVENCYDTEEQLVAVRDQEGRVHRFSRDGLGRIISEIDYWGEKYAYAYSASGSLIASTNPLGARIKYSYDPLGRLVRKELNGGVEAGQPFVETYEYDPVSNIAKMANAHVCVSREFDAEGRLLVESQSHSDGYEFSVRTDYDGVGNRTKQVMTSQGVETSKVEVAFDLMDRPVKITIANDEQLTFERDSLGQVLGEQSPLGFSRQFQYQDGQVIGQTTMHGDQRLETHYDYDGVGNLVERMDSKLGVDRYGYDQNGNIASAVSSNVGSFLQPPLTRVSSTREATPAFGWNGQFLDRTDLRYRQVSCGGQQLFFDRVGNLVRKLEGESSLELVWNANQQLVTARRKTHQEASTTVYGYDPLGRRIYKETDGERLRFGWSGDTLVHEASASHASTFIYYPGTFRPLAMVRHGSSGDRDSAVFYYCNDPNGAPVRVLSQEGRIVWEAHYSTTGSANVLASIVSNPIRLQGQFYDAETGLHYNRYRYFDPITATFISKDPIGHAAGADLYSYKGNVFGWIDPLGLTSCRAAAAANMRRMGLEGVDLANNSLNKGRKKLEEAGFELVETTSTGRKVFRHPSTRAEVYFDSGGALVGSQKPHWHIRDPAGQAYDRGGRAVGRGENAGHIPGG